MKLMQLVQSDMILNISTQTKRFFQYIPPEWILRSNDLIHNFLISLQKKKDANMDEFVNAKDKLSGADIKAMCTEAGLKSVY